MATETSVPHTRGERTTTGGTSGSTDNGSRPELHDARPRGARLLNMHTEMFDELKRDVSRWRRVRDQQVTLNSYTEAYFLVVKSIGLRTRIGGRLHTAMARVRLSDGELGQALESLGLCAEDAAECVYLFRSGLAPEMAPDRRESRRVDPSSSSGIDLSL